MSTGTNAPNAGNRTRKDNRSRWQKFLEWMLITVVGLFCAGGMITLLILRMPEYVCLLAFGFYAATFCLTIILSSAIISRLFK